MKKILYLSLVLVTLCSCTKEIELDYRDIDPIPVIEGLLAPDFAEVKITQTRNMDDSVKTPGIRVDEVKVLSGKGVETPFAFEKDGIYRPTSPIEMNDGETYTLSVTIDGVEYVGQSTLQPTIEFSEPQFLWAELMDWMQILECETTNVPDETEAFAWIRIYRNGKIYFSDAGSTTGNSPLDIGLYYDSDMEQDDEAILYTGDSIFMDFRTIDEQVYNYLNEYNAGHMNPKQFFTPSEEGKICLGYFAVFNHVTYEVIYEKTPHD
ncbi:MAG: DUF4249 family protein [Bacteroidales bacterium]|nr:DUF4249 family protein [Bacteroidales bacterium]